MGFFKGIEKLLTKAEDGDSIFLVADYFNQNVEAKLKEVLDKDITIKIIISAPSLDSNNGMIHNYIETSEVGPNGKYLMAPDSSSKTDLNDFSKYDGKVEIYKSKLRPVQHFCLLKEKMLIAEPPHKVGYCGSPYLAFMMHSWYMNRKYNKLFENYLEDSKKIIS